MAVVVDPKTVQCLNVDRLLYGDWVEVELLNGTLVHLMRSELGTTALNLRPVLMLGKSRTFSFDQLIESTGFDRSWLPGGLQLAIVQDMKVQTESPLVMLVAVEYDPTNDRYRFVDVDLPVVVGIHQA